MNNKKTKNQLEVNNIEVVYNDIVQVLRGVSLNVPEGSIALVCQGSSCLEPAVTFEQILEQIHSIY